MECGKLNNTCEGLFDMRLRDQFLSTSVCNRGLLLFLMEGISKEIQDSSVLVDQSEEATHAYIQTLTKTRQRDNDQTNESIQMEEVRLLQSHRLERTDVDTSATYPM